MSEVNLVDVPVPGYEPLNLDALSRDELVVMTLVYRRLSLYAQFREAALAMEHRCCSSDLARVQHMNAKEMYDLLPCWARW